MTDTKQPTEGRVVLPVDPTRRTEIDKQRVPMSARPYRLLALVKQDAVVRVQKEPDDTVMTWPHLLTIEFMAAALMSVFLHMMRVFYHGAYKPPREFNWVVGVILLFLTIMLSFTGYLLPWDQIAYWAITIGTNMAGYAPLFNTPSKLLLLGGIEVGQNTLLRFYVLHIMVFPLVGAIFMAVHFWRIRKDGGISGPL